MPLSSALESSKHLVYLLPTWFWSWGWGEGLPHRRPWWGTRSILGRQQGTGPSSCGSSGLWTGPRHRCLIMLGWGLGSRKSRLS